MSKCEILFVQKLIVPITIFKIQNLSAYLMGKRTRSAKRDSSGSKVRKNYSDDELIDYSVFDNITKKKNIGNLNKGNSTKMFSWIIISILLFSVLLVAGVFSPETYKSENSSNGDGTNNEPTDKIPVVLYSSPTCGCCHKYVNYLNNNGFDTFQKRTEAYKDIKDQKNIPENLRSCHTAIIGDYFVEGHIPISVVNEMLNTNPDIDGITLPNMPSGSPGMGGDKNIPWEISSIKDGENIGIFQTL